MLKLQAFELTYNKARKSQADKLLHILVQTVILDSLDDRPAANDSSSALGKSERVIQIWYSRDRARRLIGKRGGQAREE